jgi:hypothetical protein
MALDSKSGAAAFDSLAACFARFFSEIRAAVWCDSRWIESGH